MTLWLWRIYDPKTFQVCNIVILIAKYKSLSSVFTENELDSYMYQTVGHQAIDLYAEAMNLPLFRGDIKGSSLNTGADYDPTEQDEVEDLYELLSGITKSLKFDAVCSGAILSDYQRIRVENV